MKKDSIYTKDIVLILMASFFYMVSPMLTTPLIAGYAESLGAGAFLMGSIGGMMNLCSLFCRPFVGNLADRLSKYRVTAIGSSIMAAASAIYVLAPSSAWIIAGRLLHGVGYSCCSVCMATWMSNMLPREKVGTGMGLYGTMNALGMAISPSVGIYVYRHFGYRIAFAVSLVTSIAIFITVQFIGDKGEPKAPPVRETDGAGASAAQNASTGASAAVTAPSRGMQFIDVRILPLAAIIMLFTIPYYATQSFLVRYSEARELVVDVSLFFTLYAVALFILRMSLKSLFDRLAFRYFLIASVISAGCSISLLGVMNNNWLMLLAAIFMAGGYGLMCSVCQSTAILMAGVERRGLANSTYYVGLDLGMALGPIIGGLLYGSLPLEYFFPCLLFTLPLILAVYWIFLRKHGH